MPGSDYTSLVVCTGLASFHVAGVYAAENKNGDKRISFCYSIPATTT